MKDLGLSLNVDKPEVFVEKQGEDTQKEQTQKKLSILFPFYSLIST